jgi:polyphosphate glucokinase
MAGRGVPLTLAIDIGGTGIKGSVLTPDGTMIADRVRLATPDPAAPEPVLLAVQSIVARLPRFDRISVGFPGVVRRGCVVSAPNLGDRAWHGFALATALRAQFGRPARVLNDADVQGLGVISGDGIEVVLTFGTGVGSALFQNGRLAPHLELSLHPIRGKKSYNDWLGHTALEAKGRRRWNRRVAKVIAIVRDLVNFDRLYLGGGNAAKIDLDLPPAVELVSNEAGITGGVRLWDAAHDDLFDEAPHPRRDRVPRG